MSNIKRQLYRLVLYNVNPIVILHVSFELVQRLHEFNCLIPTRRTSALRENVTLQKSQVLNNGETR